MSCSNAQQTGIFCNLRLQVFKYWLASKAVQIIRVLLHAGKFPNGGA